MTKALITGASSGIGLEITKMLLDMGFLVFGVSKNGFKNDLKGNIVKLKFDLTNKKQIQDLAKTVQERAKIDLLVNCAGLAHFANHKDLSFEKISQIMDLNLKAPLLLSKLFLKDLITQKGMLINISSISARNPAKFAAAYAASKAGLDSFTQSLFEEERKNGLRVASICADMTLTPFYDNQSFVPSSKIGCHIKPKSIANALKFILSQKKGELISDIVIRPQKICIDKK